MSEPKDAPTETPAPKADDDFVDDDNNWTPPTEEELKRIEERRKKQDAISRELGQYLLKGWKMLDKHCPVNECGTVLMQDKEGRDYCVNCKAFLKYEKPDSEAASKPADAPTDNDTEKPKETPKGTEAAAGEGKEKATTTTSPTIPGKEPLFKPVFQHVKGKRHKKGKAAGSTAAASTEEDDDDSVDGEQAAPGKRGDHFDVPNAKRPRRSDAEGADPNAVTSTKPGQTHHQRATVTVRKQGGGGGGNAGSVGPLALRINVLQQSIDALEHKVDATRRQLAAADVDQSIKLCQLISEAAKAIESLMRVKAQLQ